MKRFAALLIASLFAYPTLADITIEIAETYPLMGSQVEISVLEDGDPLPGTSLSAEYRPNSRTAVIESVGVTDESGVIDWTPSDAGLVRINALSDDSEVPIATIAVSVRYVGFPLSGILTMVIAGIILFGGAGLGMSILMREEKIPEEEPPST